MSRTRLAGMFGGMFSLFLLIFQFRLGGRMQGATAEPKQEHEDDDPKRHNGDDKPNSVHIFFAFRAYTIWVNATLCSGVGVAFNTSQSYNASVERDYF